MSQAVRAIIMQENKLLVMRRDKQGNEYFTLVGGRVKDGESREQALRREVKEETGLEITSLKPVFVEMHPEPYNEQYIYLCEIKPSAHLAIQSYSEEALLNQLDFDIHDPIWVSSDSFAKIPFRTPQLQTAIVNAMSKGYPDNPLTI